uniref:EF-hand calcium-binding domain-containing protein 6-like n=1 Tax=Semicossyphus pulcher TaxID=241346 RepID=UPI0037E8E2F3
MARLLPLQPRLGPLVMGRRPHTAPVTYTHSFIRGQTGRGCRQTVRHTDTGRQITLQQVEPLIHSRLENIRSAFTALDPDGTGRVSKEDFRRVLESLLSVHQNQLNTAINGGCRVLEAIPAVIGKAAGLHLDSSPVCERSSESVDYLEFLRSFSRAPAARRASSSRCSVRRGPQNSPMSLCEIQKRLKEKVAAYQQKHFGEQAGASTDQGSRVNNRVHRDESSSEPSLGRVQEFTGGAEIGGNLRNIIRVFRLFDCDRGGHIQQLEFRRILDSYCTRLTDREFQRLWNHYSPKNTSTISYEVFLEKLGFGDSYNFRIAPVCTKLEVCSRGITPPERVKHRKQRAEDPSILPHRKLHTLFYDKMCMNSTSVWRALQAFDTARSGLVKQEVLRAVLSSFIFPMNPHSFQKLTTLVYSVLYIFHVCVWIYVCVCSYGVRAAEQVRWKHFVGQFMSPVKEDDTNFNNNSSLRILEQPDKDEDNLNIQDIYPQLNEIFHLLDEKEAGRITRADLRHLLERPNGTRTQNLQPRLHRSQITELLNVLDPEHTGLIQLSNMERLNPKITPSDPDPAEPLGVPEQSEDPAGEQESSQSQTSQAADEESAAQRRVEDLLQEKLCEQLSAVLEALKLFDPQHSGYVTQEDLRTVLSCCGISDTHLSEKEKDKMKTVERQKEAISLPKPATDLANDKPALVTERPAVDQGGKLCETCGSRPGSPSKLVHYTDLLRNMGGPLPHTLSSDKKCNHTERPCTSPESTLQSVREHQPPPSSLQTAPDACSILDVVFQRMRSRLEERHRSLTDRIQAVTHSSDGTLSESDVKKILEDSWVILDDKDFNKFTDLLGFRGARIQSSSLLQRYEEATDSDGRQRSKGRKEVEPLLTTADQCLAAMKTRIKSVHGDNLTAFLLMDRKRKGVVDRHDFKDLYDSLGFFCREDEYERLLDRIGLHPGGNLNYAEFVDVVANKGKSKQGTQTERQQLHELLSSEARYKWADMSKVLCQLDSDGRGWIHKNSLRRLLFTYSLPLTSEEFGHLWSRYDPESRGRVEVCDFLEKLGFHREWGLGRRSQKLNQQEADGPASSDAASLERLEKVLQENYEAFSDSLPHLDSRRDGTVTVEELQSLLNACSCSVRREQLLKHLRRLNVSMDENSERLSYMDFLSAFDHKPEKKSERPPVTPDALRQIESLDDLSPDAALVRMRELVTASASNLFKAFSAFDRSRAGTLTAQEFRQVLENFCARLSDKQFRFMLTKLELDCENCTVNWKDFLNKFQSKSQPTKTSEISEQPQQTQEVVSSHLHEITKELMDLDPSDSATIPKEQLRQLCDGLTDDQFECVSSQMPVNEQRKLQYREFLRRVGAQGRTPHTEGGGSTSNLPLPSPEPRGSLSAAAILQRTKSAPRCSSRRPASAGRPGTGSPAGSVERRLRGAVQSCWKEIQRSCREEDPQQDGLIGTECFLKILRSLGISVTQEQFERLAVKSDIMSNGCVSYHDFLRHFLLNLNPVETEMKFERRKLPLPTAQASQSVPSKACVDAMLRIYDVVRSSWTSIRRCFLSSDRARTGTVSVQDFRKVLCQFSVNLSSDEFFHVSSYFDGSSTGKICYNNFLWAFLH